MTEKLHFVFPNIFRRKDHELIEFESLINLLPHPSLLVDANNQRIITGNARVVEISGFSAKELAGKKITDLISDWKLPENLENKQVKFKDKSNHESSITINQKKLPPKGKRVLIHLEPYNLNQKQKRETQRLDQFWEKLHQLVEVPLHDNFDQAIDQALDAARILTESDIIYIYQAETQEPELIRTKWIGPEKFLPETLPSQDLIHLRQPHIWIPGKRPLSVLHRMAKDKGASFISTAPLGQSHAVIGLIAIADLKTTPTIHTAQMTKLIGATITTLIQEHARVTALRNEIDTQRESLLIKNVIDESISEGVLILSPDLTIKNANASAELMLGYSFSEMEHTPVDQILIGSDDLNKALEEAQNLNPTYDLGKLGLYRRYGEAFTAQIQILPITERDEVLKTIIVILIDLTEQEQIREKTQQLEQRAFLGEALAVFAHEVRNPINNISTGLQLISFNLKDDDSNQELLSRLSQDLDRLDEMMTSVLAFSRSTDYDMESVGLENLIKRLLDRLHPRLARSNVQHRFQSEKDLPDIEGNHRALEQVFTNLINNAVQAMSETGGKLSIKLQQIDGPKNRPYLEVSVADSGPGIPKEHLDQIFHPFFTTHHGGTGLGLAIAKRIITAHKGNTNVTSFPGGTIFYVQIPLPES